MVRSGDGGRRGLAPFAALLASFLAAGCCSNVRCGLIPDTPRFGDATRELMADVAALPEWVEDEFALRGDRLATFGSTWADGRAKEAERTADHVANLGPAVARDFRNHGGALVDFLGRQGARARTDACCFFERAWHSILLAAE
jgi:hypothetical protein